MSLAKSSRKVHRWGSLITMLPVGFILFTGIILQLKKHLDWVQPPTVRGTDQELAISFNDVLSIVQSAPEAEIAGWHDIDRLDVRPAKGMLKVRAKNRWEIQIDTTTGEILQVAYRRSDLIESLHDGSFFSSFVKLGIFLPSAVILLGLWLTGIHLFILPHSVKWKRRQQVSASKREASVGSQPIEDRCA